MRRLLIPVAAFVAIPLIVIVVALAYPTDYQATLFGRSFDDAARIKAWLATAIAVLAAGQLVLALWLYRRLPALGPPPRPVGRLHRVGGAVIFLVSLPVAAHCIQAYGFQLSPLRPAAHSFAGAFFYGAFAAKVLVVRSRTLPGWALPVAGGLMLTVIAVLWASSALWFFSQ